MIGQGTALLPLISFFFSGNSVALFIFEITVYIVKKFFSDGEYVSVGGISNPFNISPLLTNYDNNGNNDQASSD